MLEIIKQTLLSIVDRIDAGNSDLNEEQLEEALELINRMSVPETKYSKYQACKYLGISRSTFDRYVKDGLIPEGRRQQGFKEIFYLKQDLDESKRKILSR